MVTSHKGLGASDQARCVRALDGGPRSEDAGCGQIRRRSCRRLCAFAYLIPDFIPVLGYLDDLLIVPLGIMLAVKLVPAPLMAEFRAAAAERENRPDQESLACHQLKKSKISA